MELLKKKDIGHILTKSNQTQYLDQLSRYKFCICPPGNGIDCHRTWECLYLGVIPIVYYHCHNLQFLDLPILIINDWDIITDEYLVGIYNEFQKKKFNFDKLDITYWDKLINKSIN